VPPVKRWRRKKGRKKQEKLGKGKNGIFPIKILGKNIYICRCMCYNEEWFGAFRPEAPTKVPKIGKIYIKKRRKLKHGKKKAFYGW
jgi:hypothetical protein